MRVLAPWWVTATQPPEEKQVNLPDIIVIFTWSQNTAALTACPPGDCLVLSGGSLTPQPFLSWRVATVSKVQNFFTLNGCIADFTEV